MSDPLAIVASSGSIQSDKRGPKPSAKVRYDPEFARRMAQNRSEGADKTATRLESLSYAFDRYLSNLPEGHVLRYGERLLGSEGAYWKLYSRGEVEEILAAFG